MPIFSGKLVLASASPRRKELLSAAGFHFEVITKEIDESWPGNLKKQDVAIHIAQKKASAYDLEVAEGKTIITADTIVCIDEEILNKPADTGEAMTMLRKLSGRDHEVITAVCIRNQVQTECFHVTTTVSFRPLKDDEIMYYIGRYKPFDKAGAYGIQEWIGLVAITGINGSYHNVVGLPVAELYQKLMTFPA
jgi:septum formation protein